jgi:choline dehydrogenase-like flavoprotein
MNAVTQAALPAAERCPSYYSATLNQETHYPTLQGHHSVDVVIIGGGFTGVASAVELAERGLKVALVEARKIGWGANYSGRDSRDIAAELRPGIERTFPQLKGITQCCRHRHRPCSPRRAVTGRPKSDIGYIKSVIPARKRSRRVCLRLPAY